MDELEKFLDMFNELYENKVKVDEYGILKLAGEKAYKILTALMEAGFTRTEAFDLIKLILTVERGGRN